jgi:hypothetical protein
MSKKKKDVLHLVLNYHWYDMIVSGNKSIEYRENRERWNRIIFQNREQYKFVRFARGYTSEMVTYKISKIDIGLCPYPLWEGEYIRIHFYNCNCLQLDLFEESQK